MHRVTVLLWFLCFVLETAVSTILIYPVKSELPKQKLEKVDHGGAEVSTIPKSEEERPERPEVDYYDYQDEKNWAHIGERNATSITIHIKLDKDAKYRLLGTEVSYRLKSYVIVPASLEWNQTISYYVARKARQDRGNGTLGHHFRQFRFSSVEGIIIVSDLPFPDTSYEFDLTYHLEDKYRKIEVIEGSTFPLKPANPLKTGSGCFRVYNVNSTSRSVKIYWPQPENNNTKFKVSVYEEGDFTPIFKGRGENVGYMWMKISLRRHYFNFRDCNEAGCSEDSSTVVIPDQEDILPALKTRVFKTKRKNQYVLKWWLPEDTDVTNYTLFWHHKAGPMYDRELFVKDFVYLNRSTPQFVKVKGDHRRRVELAISVNNVKGSSGLQTVQQYDFIPDLFTFV